MAIRVSIELVLDDLDDLEAAIEALTSRVRRDNTIPYVKHVSDGISSEAIIAVKELDEAESRPIWSAHHNHTALN